MNRRLLTTVLGAGAVLAASTPARAQQYAETTETHVAAPANAVELHVNGGYTQGFGVFNPAPGVDMRNIGDAGVGVGAGVGWRILPQVSIGVTGQYQEINPANQAVSGTHVRGMTVGPEVTMHFTPYEHIDPWLSLSAGYRAVWIVPADTTPTTMIHGIEIARVMIGADYRGNEDVALGPFVGADMNVFLWENPGTGNVSLGSNRSFDTFVLAGIQGRFDIGGDRRPAESNAYYETTAHR